MKHLITKIPNKTKLVTISLLLLALATAVHTDSADEKNVQQHWLFSSINDLNRQIKYFTRNAGEVGIAVKDLKSSEYFSINGDIEFNPASVIKVPIMAEAFHQKKLGIISFEDKIELKEENKMIGSGILPYYKSGTKFTIGFLIDMMITRSDNTATHMLINHLGMKNINNYMKAIGLKDTSVVDDTLLCKVPGKFNKTTPDDMLLLLEKMYNGELVSKEDSLEMIEVLKKQKYRWGIPRFLPSSSEVANKTGSLRGVRNDIGIVFTDTGAYAVIIFTRKMPSNVYAATLVSRISRVIYNTRIPLS